MDITFTRQIGRDVFLRPDTKDTQVWADTFTGLYHVPPDTMPTPSTVLDLGANIGLVSAHYQYLWPQARIVAVEMDAHNLSMIHRNAPGVRMRWCAVSDTNGDGSYIGAETDAFRLVDGDEGGGVRVTTRTLGWLARGGVDFCKMDIEGAEWRVLKSRDWFGKVRHLLVELHDDNTDAETSDRLVDEACNLLEDVQGMKAERFVRHPRAVYAWLPS